MAHTIYDTCLYPQTTWTAKNLTEVTNSILGGAFDTQKLRLIGFNSIRFIGTTITAPANTVFIIISNLGLGTLLIDNVTVANGQQIKDNVCVQLREGSALNSVTVQYAIFTWD